jgi:hypothetical protein
MFLQSRVKWEKAQWKRKRVKKENYRNQEEIEGKGAIVRLGVKLKIVIARLLLY